MDDLTKAGIAALVREAAGPFVETLDAVLSVADDWAPFSVSIRYAYDGINTDSAVIGTGLQREDFERLRRLLELFKEDSHA